MTPSRGPVAEYRRYWLPELAVLAALAAAATALFALTDLDIRAARLFFRPGLADPWPVAARPPWLLFYRSAPWVTASLAVTGVALLVAGALSPARRHLRIYGIFVMLSVAAGPGLIVNGILKDHWGRPRPRQIVEFGGRLPYAPPLVPAGTPGKSFPCGHCSVGYLYAAGWWVWRRRKASWAAASLAVGSALGTLLGIGRMAAGGHFLSDAVWSGLIALGVAHALYYYVLRVPAREDRRADVYPLMDRSPRARAAAVAGAALLGLGIVGGGILATPHHRDLAAGVRVAELPAPPEAVHVLVDTLDVEIRLVAGPSAEIAADGYVHGFGLPTNAIRAGWEFEARPAPTLVYRLVERGWFTDIDGIARIRIPVPGVRRVAVRAARGDIRVVDATGGGVAQDRFPSLDLHTGAGRIWRQDAAGGGGEGK